MPMCLAHSRGLQATYCGPLIGATDTCAATNPMVAVPITVPTFRLPAPYAHPKRMTD
ncbi:hypothetical protein [Streptomyces canus]|uniref:hypothetical protein n=1 Tax=Streptomyces canus TaxID=58343 RepID=UPI002E371FFD|nr:hypothetical protein [Streptomyces canus]